MPDESRATSVDTDEMHAVQTRKTSFGEVFGAARRLLGHSSQLVVPWLLIVGFEALCIFTTHGWISDIRTWNEDAEYVTSAIVMTLFEIPFIMAAALVLLAGIAVAATARATLWTAMGDMLITEHRTAVLGAVSLTRGLLVGATFAIFGLILLASACMTGCASGLGAPIAGLILTPLIAAPYFAGRRRSIGDGLALSAKAFRQNPLVIVVAALVCALTWWAPQFVLVMEGGEVLSSLERVQSVDGFLVLASLVVALVGGYFGWIFVGAAFVCVDAEFQG